MRINSASGLLWLLLILLTGLIVVACASPDQLLSKVPVLLFVQASPDRMTLEAIVPNSLIKYAGNVEAVQKQLNEPKTPLAMMQFGKSLAEFESKDRQVVDNFGGIAIFRLKQPFRNNFVLSQQGVIILPQTHANPLPVAEPSYQYNCPSKAQTLVARAGQAEFLKMGISQDQVARMAIASIVCADIDGDQMPEIITGLRLDNPLRPAANDTGPWQKFLNLPADKRQEYSTLIILRGAGDQWTTEPIITHRRALAYLNDSVSSFLLANAQDLNGDRRLELVVQEISLSNINLWLLAPNLDPATSATQPWLDYYLPERSPNLLE